MNWTDLALYASIAGLTAAQAVRDWQDPQAYVGVLLATLIAVKAKRSKGAEQEASEESDAA